MKSYFYRTPCALMNQLHKIDLHGFQVYNPKPLQTSTELSVFLSIFISFADTLVSEWLLPLRDVVLMCSHHSWSVYQTGLNASV